jgi:ornithine carbamoyltransferase
MAVRHFLTLLDLSAHELHALIQRARELKKMLHAGQAHELFHNKVLGMIFEKSSTRTRVSFEAAMLQCGGGAIFLSPRDTQLGRGEPVADTARVLSRMVDAIVVRTYAHEKLEEFAAHSQVPVINALTDMYHPCQLLADVQTIIEHRGTIQGQQVAWIGDGNNMCHSYINAAIRFGFKLHVAAPPGYAPQPEVLANAQGHVIMNTTPQEAVQGADVLVTDVWASMGQEKEQKQRSRTFAPYKITPAVMALAKEDAIFLHCLPAHRDEEVSPEVIEGSQSVVWDEAENRLHSQKALLELLLVSP